VNPACVAVDIGPLRAMFAVTENGKKLRYGELDNIDNKGISLISNGYTLDIVIHQAQNI
jgi:hypothetical protein